MFKYYNANPFGRHVNDCSVRALSLALNKSWNDTYIELSNYAREEGITFSEVEFLDQYLADRFQRYCWNRDIKDFKLQDFLNLQLPGIWIITMAGHITCVINGTCYDTFDPSQRYVWCIYFVGYEEREVD